MGTRLYVGNLSYKATEDELREAFSRHGGVEKVDILTDRATGQQKGFCFVEMMTEEDATSAIAAMDGAEFAGRMLRVEVATPRPEHRDRGDFDRNRESRLNARPGGRRWRE